jgi:hypothetical protein
LQRSNRKDEPSAKWLILPHTLAFVVMFSKYRILSLFWSVFWMWWVCYAVVKK